MSNVYDTIDEAIIQVSEARKRVLRIKSKQVRGVDEITSLKATAQTWFRTHRPIIGAFSSKLDISIVDGYFQIILDATARYAAKSTYLSALENSKLALLELRTVALVAPLSIQSNKAEDVVPDFSPLAGNHEMRDILTRRWLECAKCVKADAHLAAIVMMGGLLEALFVARANQMIDKAPLTSAKDAPKDKTTGKTTNYQDWMLDSYIKVAFELKWITESAKGLADTLKEFRNFVHPAKELRYGVTLGLNDSSIFWQVTKALTRQLLQSAKTVP